MKHLAAYALAGLVALAAPVLAQENPVVVELYTSQGCSSCPPADEILHELAERDDVIALALHVDYWDYIGWKDPFGNAAHAARQRAYAAAGHRQTIYTPEMIVAGQSDVVGARPMKLAKAIAEHARMPAKVSLDAHREGGTLDLKASAIQALDGPVHIHIVTYSPLETTQIKRGENAGRTLKYANVVMDWRVAGQWDGASDFSAQFDVPSDAPLVVIVQQDQAGPILAAQRLR